MSSPCSSPKRENGPRSGGVKTVTTTYEAADYLDNDAVIAEY
jgi:hypothetical protein